MKVAIYARVSTDEQARKYSIRAQLDLPRNHAQPSAHGVFEEHWRETQRNCHSFGIPQDMGQTELK